MSAFAIIAAIVGAFLILVLLALLWAFKVMEREAGDPRRFREDDE